MGSVTDLKPYFGRFTTKRINIKDYPIIALDTEDNSKGTPVLFCFYGDFKKGQFTTRHADDALKFIWDIEEPTVFVTHNLEYDIANLFKQSDYLMVDRMMYAATLLRVDLYGTKHFFLNSTQFFKGPLKKMAPFVGLEKLDGDALDPEYCMRDAEIVYKFTKEFQKKLHRDAGVNLEVTIGKMAMDTYRKNHMLAKKQITYNSPGCLKAYYGGRVEIFKKGITGNINVVDINACYPFVMRNYEYPDTSTIEPSALNTHRFGIGEFSIWVPEDTFVPVLPHKSKDGRLFFPVGEIRGWWTYPEVRYAVEHGAVILKEYQGEGTNTGCMPFNSFIDTYYEKRQECKAKKALNPDDVEAEFDDLFYKYWLNNLYGKWCQHKDGVEMTRDRWPFWKVEKAMKNPKFKTNKIGPFYNYVVPKSVLPETANFMWGIYVTSYSRIYLHKGIQAIHNAGHTLLYTDTDSIMYSPRHDEIPFKITDKLGDWDIEKFDLGIFRQSKGYLLCDKKNDNYEIKKVACKGVPTAFAYDFIIEGMATVMKPYRLKEALIRLNAAANAGKDEFLKEIGENVWREVEKNMKSIYIKRRGDSITYPVNVDEITELEKDTSVGNKSIKRELKKNGISIKKKTHKDKFANTVIPDGYFDRGRKRQGKPRLFISQKLFHFRSEQCSELEKGQIWFTGDVLQIRTNPQGKESYHIFVTVYKDRKLTANFWGSISRSFFDGYGCTENLLEKKVEVSLRNIYLEESSLDLSINVFDSKLKGQIETELIDEKEELSKKELETLMAFDWSTINVKN